MVPVPRHHSSRLIVLVYSIVSNNVRRLFNHEHSESIYPLAKRAESEPHDAKFIAFACLIPVLVILSGVFAGLTLGYMSLDETQLNVLSISGTP